MSIFSVGMTYHFYFTFIYFLNFYYLPSGERQITRFTLVDTTNNNEKFRITLTKTVPRNQDYYIY